MFDINVSDKARVQLKKLPKEVQARVIAVLERVRMRPGSYFKKLVDEPYFRLRVGKYRLIVDIKYGVLLVVAIKHRKDAYK